MGNGLVQLIRMDGATRQMRDNFVVHMLVPGQVRTDGSTEVPDILDYL